MDMGVLRILLVLLVVSAASISIFYYVGVSTETSVQGMPETTTTTIIQGELVSNFSFANMSVQYPTNVSIEWLEQRTFDLVNKERENEGLRPLTWNPGITGVARLHSMDMAVNGYFSHDGLDGSYVSDRLREGEIYYWNMSAENLFMSSGYDYYYTNILGKITYKHYVTFEQLAQNATQGWMESEGHRKNILTASLDESGLGVYFLNDSYYFTQNFITRISCGYKDGQCCHTPGYYPWCYDPWSCVSGMCA